MFNKMYWFLSEYSLKSFFLKKTLNPPEWDSTSQVHSSLLMFSGHPILPKIGDHRQLLNGNYTLRQQSLI